MLAFGIALTTVSSGWIAPAVARADAIAQHDRFVRDNSGRLYTPPF